MGELQLKGIEEGPVISIGKHAAILQATYDGKPAMIKSFRPEEFEREYAQMQAIPSLITMEGGYKRSRPYYFEKEERVLYLLTQHFQRRTIGKLAPEYYNCNLSRLQVVMERVDDRTYRDQFVEIEDKFANLEDRLKEGALEPEERLRQERKFREQKEQEKKPYWEQMLEQVTRFNLATNIREVRDSFLQLPYYHRPLVGLRTREEERNRLAHYIRLIVFTHCDEFRSRYGVTHHWEYTQKEWKRMKKGIRTFLGEKGLPFDQFINAALERHRRILYGTGDPYANQSDQERLITEGKLAIVHGDLGPQNVFHGGEEFRKTIDFDELRLDSPQFDVVHALYHVASNPSESSAYRLLRDYFIQDYPVSGAPLSDLFSEHLAVRLFEGVRKLASDDRMSLHELRKFSGGLKRANRWGRDLILRSNFDRHQEFIKFYRDDEGADALREDTEKIQLVNKQLDEFSKFFYRITIPGSGFSSALSSPSGEQHYQGGTGGGK